MGLYVIDKKYAKDKDLNCKIDAYWFNYFSDFSRDIKANKPCIFSFGAYYNNEKFNHTVLVIGTLETSKYEYLKIFDGFDKNVESKYINYNGYEYLSKQAFSVNITSKSSGGGGGSYK